MALNWTTNVIIGLIAFIPIFSAFILALHEYLKNKHRHALFMSLGWFFVTLWCVFVISATLLLSQFISYLIFLVWIPTGYVVVLLLDSFSRESVDPRKILLITGLSTALLIFSFEPNIIVSYTYPTGEKAFANAMGRPFTYSFALLTLSIGGLFAYYTYKIHINVPQSLNFYSRINLTGAITMGVITPIIVGLGIEKMIPAINMITMAIGALTMTIAFLKEPKLAFILPFKAIRLTVIERSGLPLFSYSWSKLDDLVEEELFSGMLQAVSMFVDESLQKGNVKEIHLDRAILILQRSKHYPTVCVLVANKSSQSLRRALDSFSERFDSKYSQHFSLPIQTKPFETGIDLIRECFPFVPDYN